MRVVPGDKVVNGQIVLKIADPDSKFFGIEYYYEGMKFADEENEDGSLNMSFDYQVVTGTVADEHTEEFGRYLGENLMEILEDQMKRDSVIYHGGVDDSTTLPAE
jgi:hypothetical protein